MATILISGALVTASADCADAPVEPPTGGRYEHVSGFGDTRTEHYRDAYRRSLSRTIDAFDDTEIGRRAYVGDASMSIELSCGRSSQEGRHHEPRLNLYLGISRFSRRDYALQMAKTLSYRIDDGDIVNLDIGHVDLSRSPLDQAFALRLIAILRAGGLFRARLYDARGGTLDTLAIDIRGFAHVHDWVARSGCHYLLPEVSQGNS